MPDIAAMEALEGTGVNPPVAPQYAGTVDLVQVIVGYQAFVNSLAAHHTVQKAVSDANNAINALYPTLNYANTTTGQLPQVIYTVGNSNGNLCLLPACKE